MDTVSGALLCRVCRDTESTQELGAFDFFVTELCTRLDPMLWLLFSKHSSNHLSFSFPIISELSSGRIRSRNHDEKLVAVVVLLQDDVRCPVHPIVLFSSIGAPQTPTFLYQQQVQHCSWCNNCFKMKRYGPKLSNRCQWGWVACWKNENARIFRTPPTTTHQTSFAWFSSMQLAFLDEISCVGRQGFLEVECHSRSVEKAK